ncbi:MAG: class I SAM-dependent methyltransferase [Bacteroidota bacterium]
MQAYYEKRQPEYEAIYQKPERQEDLLWLCDALSPHVRRRRVLELACGTGYWTRRMKHDATSIHATDISAQLAEAAVMSCDHASVTGDTLDAFNLPDNLDFDCVVAGFLYSHILIEQRASFLKGLTASLPIDTTLLLYDNKYVPGSSTPISRTTPTGDTYQRRKLKDGSQHEVLKNFPTKKELQTTLQPFCNDVVVLESTYFWFATGKLRG